MSEAELRSMVREILREALAQRRAGANATLPSSDPPVVEPVRITSDDDLMAFVRRLVLLMEEPAGSAAIRAGRRRFVLANSDDPMRPAQSKSSGAPPVEVLEGTVTEAKVARLAGIGRVRLAPGAVLTPLASDRLRALGITIEGRR